MAKKQQGRDYNLSIEELIALPKYNYRKHDQSHIDWLKGSITDNGLKDPLGIGIVEDNQTLIIGNGRAEAIISLYEENPDQKIKIKVRYEYFDTNKEMINRAVSSNQGARETVFELSTLLNENEDFDSSNITIPSYYALKKGRVMYVNALKKLVRYPALEEPINENLFQIDNRRGKGLSWVYLLQFNEFIILQVIGKINESEVNHITCTMIDKWASEVGITIDEKHLISIDKEYVGINKCTECKKCTYNEDVFGKVVNCYDSACAKLKLTLAIAELRESFDTNFLIDFDRSQLESDFGKDFIKNQLKGFKVLKNAKVLDNEPCTFAKKAISLTGKSVVSVCFDECCPVHSNNINVINAGKDNETISKKTERLEKKWKKARLKKIEEASVAIIKEEFSSAIDGNEKFIEDSIIHLMQLLIKNPGSAEDYRKLLISNNEKIYNNDFWAKVYMQLVIDTANHEMHLENKSLNTLNEINNEYRNLCKKEIQDAKNKVIKKQTNISTKFLEMKKFIKSFIDDDNKDILKKINEEFRLTCKTLNVNRKDYEDTADKSLLVKLIKNRIIEFGFK